ncbi:MAG: TadE/TadG family type IV pilus assembly protein [Agathobacter sp.]
MSLWNRKEPYKFNTSPQLRIDINHILSKETSFYTCQRASLTLEAAVIFPLISMFFVTLLFLFKVLYIQLRIEEALIYAGRKVAVESSVVEDEALQIASAKALVLWELREDKVISRYVQGGELGVVLLGSEFQEDRIVLQATYKVKFPVNMIGMEGITLWSRNAFQKWTGDLPKSETDGWVYVVPNGEVYHKLESCRALTIRVKSAFFWTMETVRGKNGQKYYACSQCVEKIADDDVVYFTDYGERYHQRLNCGYIKRTVEKKKLSEVSGRRPCSLCCGGE